jgi:uncharacterized protein YggE
MFKYILTLSLFFFGYAQADSLKDSVANIEVTGEASEEIAPDRATLRLGVVTERPTAPAAEADNAAIVTAILAELKAMGVPDAEMQTQGVTLAPEITEEPAPKGKPRQTQIYRATNMLVVRLQPPEKAGEAIGRVVAKGANSVDGVDYDSTDLTAQRDALRARAVKDAERRAAVYAQAAGLRLARVLEIRPGADVEAVPMAMEARAAAPVAGAPPVRPGRQRLVERVVVTWALAR